MFAATTDPHEARLALHRGLASGRLLRFPGAFTPLSAPLIEDKGFDGVYISGAVLSNELGLPDIGLTTMSEVARRGGEIARMTSLPCLIDADTGFGEPINVGRTVVELERAGLAGCHIEDQVNPKRCGHLDGKQVVDDPTAFGRIRAAVDARRDEAFLIMARTDLRANAPLEVAIERMRGLVRAGADAVFPEALRTLDEFKAVRDAIDVPLLANMTEFGKSELFSHAALEAIGINVVIHPVSMLRVALGAMERALDDLATTGTLEGQVPGMQTRARLYELVGYDEYGAYDQGIFDFAVPGLPVAPSHPDSPPSPA